MRGFGMALLATAVLLLGPMAPGAVATTVTIVNLDGPGVGLNDTTPAAPVGGNTGVTKGAQALQAFEHAASIWESYLDSGVEIMVDASFAPLACTAFSGTLGSAGAGTVHYGFPNAPLASTWYPQALANSLAGSDLNAGVSDIDMQFNGAMGTTGCLESLSWYMGLDSAAPAGTVSLASVALHELGHGLGFLSMVNLETGVKFGDKDDAYMVPLEDHSTGEFYPSMTNLDRVLASKVSGLCVVPQTCAFGRNAGLSCSSDEDCDPGDLHWTGAAVVAASGALTSGAHASGHVKMYAPDPQEVGSSVSHWNKSLDPNELMEPSYTGVNLDPGLAVELMSDIGWVMLGGPVVCGAPVTESSPPSASDALSILQTAVGMSSCALCICDVDSNGSVAASDALRVLQRAVGLSVTLVCPAC